MSWNELEESLQRAGPWTLGVVGTGGWFVGAATAATRRAPAPGSLPTITPPRPGLAPLPAQAGLRGEGGPGQEAELQAPDRAA